MSSYKPKQLLKKGVTSHDTGTLRSDSNPYYIRVSDDFMGLLLIKGKCVGK